MRTCGTCRYWRRILLTDAGHGECRVGAPFWAFEKHAGYARFQRASDPGAADCECYVNALPQEDADG